MMTFFDKVVYLAKTKREMVASSLSLAGIWFLATHDDLHEKHRFSIECETIIRRHRLNTRQSRFFPWKHKNSSYIEAQTRCITVSWTQTKLNVNAEVHGCWQCIVFFTQISIRLACHASVRIGIWNVFAGVLSSRRVLQCCGVGWHRENVRMYGENEVGEEIVWRPFIG